MCGADPVAVSDGGESLHVGVQQLGQRRRLSLAELRELRRNRLNGAMVLAELGAGGDGVDRRRVALGGERTREALGVDSCLWIDTRTHPGGELGGAAAGELLDGRLTTLLGQKAQGAGGELVIRARSSRVTSIGKRVLLGRTSAASLGVGIDRLRTDGAGGQHGIEVTPDSRRGKTEAGTQLGGGAGSQLNQQARDAVTGAGVDLDNLYPRRRRCFHNTIVP